MSPRLMTLAASLAFVAALTTFPAGAGHREGNGGDYIRATYMRMGHAVIQHLKTTPEGKALVQAHHLSVDDLTDQLSIAVIKVSDTPLADNGESQVDALGEPGKITLYHGAWFEHFERDRDVYFLVLHEMLRAAGVDDDDYVISGRVRPFPEDGKIATSIGSSIPLIAEDDVERYIDISQPAVNGSGCPSGYGALADFDAAHNVLGLRISELSVSDYSGASLPERRENCILSLQTRQLPPGKRLVVTQIDAMGDVELPPHSTFTMTAEAYLGGSVSQSGIQTKTVAAGAVPVNGRTLLRASGNMLTTECGSAGKLLNISVSGRTQRHVPSANTESRGRVHGISLSLRLKSC